MLKKIFLISSIFFTFNLPVFAKSFWEPIKQINEAQANSLIINSKGDIFTCTRAGLFVLKNKKNWEKINNFNGIPEKIKIDKKDNIYILTKDKSLFFSNDNAISFKEIYHREDCRSAPCATWLEDFDITNNNIVWGLETQNLDGDSYNQLIKFDNKNISIKVDEDVKYIFTDNKENLFLINGDEYSDKSIKISQDKGKTFKTLTYDIKIPEDYQYNHKLLVSKKGTIYLYVPDYALFSSNDLMKNWKKLYDFKDTKMNNFLLVNEQPIIQTENKTQVIDDKNNIKILNINNLKINSYLNISDNTFLATNKGIYQQDSKQNFIPINDGLEGVDITSMVTDKYSNIYVLTKSNNLYKSSDEGNNWELKSEKLDSLDKDFVPNRLYINDNSLILEGYNLAFISNNDGKTWEKKNKTDLSPENIAKFNNYEIKLQDNKIYYSKDNGKTWIFTAINKEINTMYLNSEKELIFQDDNNIFILKNNNNKFFLEKKLCNSKEYSNHLLYLINTKGLSYSINCGLNWLYKYSALDNINEIDTFYSNNNKYSLLESDKYLYISTNKGLFKSTDIKEVILNEAKDKINSNKFILEPTNGPFGAGIAKLFNLGNKIIIRTSSDSLYISDSKILNWTKLDVGLNSSSKLWISKSGVMYLNEGAELKSSNDFGKTFTNISKPSIKNSYLDFENAFFNQNNEIFFSTNKGVYTIKNNKLLNIGLLDQDISYIFFNKKDIYAYSNNSLYKSSNSVKKWNKINFKFDSPRLSLINDNSIFLYSYDKAYFSKDNGKTWANIKTSFIPESYIIDKNNRVMGLKNSFIYYSTDYGKNWKQYIEATGDYALNDINLNKDSKIIFSTNNGIYTLNEKTKQLVPNNNGLNEYMSYNINYKNGIIYTNLYSSKNNGKTWEISNKLFDNQGEFQEDNYFNPLDQFNDPFINYNEKNNKKVTDKMGHIFISTDNGVMKSTDKGNNWVTSSVTDESFYIFIENDKLTVLTKNGIYTSLDGKKWIKESINTSFYPTTRVTKKGETVYIIDEYGIYSYNLTNKEYKLIGFQNDRIINSYVNDNGRLFILTNNNVFYTDDFKNWLSITLTKQTVLNSFVIDDKGYLFLATNNGVYKSNISIKH